MASLGNKSLKGLKIRHGDAVVGVMTQRSTEAKMTQNRRKNLGYQIHEMRNAARHLEAAAGCLSALKGAWVEEGQETGRLRSYAAERNALLAKADDLLENARLIAALDHELETIWAGCLDREAI